MSRRPLGASLPPAERLVAYDRWIRDERAALEVMEDALQAFETGIGADGRRLSAACGWSDLRGALTALQDLKNRPIGRRPGPRPRSETVPTS